MRHCVFIITWLYILGCYVQAAPEQGVWTETITKEHSKVMFTKSLYKGADVKVKLNCASTKPKDGSVTKVAVRFAGRMTQCQGEFNDIDDPVIQDRADYYIMASAQRIVDDEHVLYFLDKSDKWYQCTDNIIILKDHGDRDWLISTENVTRVDKPAEKPSAASVAMVRKKRASDAANANADANAKQKTNTTSVIEETQDSDSGDLHRIAVTKEDGIYLFAFSFECAFFNEKTGKIDANDRDCDFSISMTIEMHHDKYGFLSAIDWPELPFYATMCAIYGIFALVWLTLCLCYWRDIIRLQFWIAGLIFLGLVEKSIFLAEYQAVYSTGLSLMPGAVVIAELVSSWKRTLARTLIVIVSVGFGIVRPRLGPVLNRVLIIGGLYFVCAFAEGCLRQLHPKGDNSWLIIGSVLPLALIDAILCCWIFTDLMQTIRQLRVRRNVAKLALYKHFTNVLIFAVLASLVFMVWSAVEHKLAECVIDWKELWMDDAFWQMLFSTILLVIIVLFRPSNNAVKYAFQPLPDNDEDGDGGDDQDEVIMTNLSDEVKKKQRVGDRTERNGKMQAAKDNDDLKWVEENIPVAEGTLPGLLDSDEEIVASKYERNKME